MRARVEADLRLTSTTDARIEDLIDEAARLRQEYGVPTGFQRAPFFEIQTDRFALARRRHRRRQATIDAEQTAWLRGRARPRARQDDDGDPRPSVLRRRPRHDASATTSSRALKQLLREHDVTIVMAGDTHDLEYYVEPARPGAEPIHHFVNGGGGAYLSFGTALAWPAQPADADWAYYPDTTGGRREDRGATRRGGSGRPGGGRSSTAPGRSRPSGSRRCSTTTSRRSFRASSRCASSGPRTASCSGRTAFTAG